MLYGADCQGVEKGVPKMSMMTMGKFMWMLGKKKEWNKMQLTVL